MAISQKKYVDITSRFPVNESVDRILGGLVFTKARMNEGVPADLIGKKRAYDSGELVSLDYEEAQIFFNKADQTGDSKEAEFALNYYGYSSPNGYVPSALKFARVMSTNVPVYAPGTAYASDDLFEYHGVVYKVTSGVTAAQNTYFYGASHSFSSSAIPAHSSSSTYDAGDLFTHTDSSVTSVYRALTDIESGTAFSELSEGTDIEKVNTSVYGVGKAYAAGDVVSVSSAFYSCTVAILASDNNGWEDGFAASVNSGTVTYSYETPAAALTRIDKSDNSFGSFTFLGDDYTDDDIKGATTANAGLSDRYLACVEKDRGNKSAIDMVAAMNGCVNSGTKGVVFVQGSNGLSAYMPMAIFASTDYDDGGEVSCHMYKQFGNEPATVFNDADYDKLSANYVNFYGQTQSNGKKISFYQRGFNTDGTDTAVYCNEVWFKSRCLTRLMNMFIAKERVPANNEGLAMVAYEVGEVCNLATRNGSFMAKDPSDSNALTIRTIISKAGENTSLADEILKAIGNVGYYVWTYLYKDVSEYKIGYYVFYGTADSIRFIKGDDLLVK